MNTDRDIAMQPPFGGRFDNWRLMGTVLWGIGVGVMFVVIQTIATLIVVLRDQSDVGEDKVLALLAASADDGFALSIATLASTFICVPVLIGIAKLKKDSNITDYFALKAVPTRSLVPWLGILAIFLALSDTLTIVLGRPVVPEFLSAAYGSAGSLALLWLAMVLAAGCGPGYTPKPGSDKVTCWCLCESPPAPPETIEKIFCTHGNVCSDYCGSLNDSGTVCTVEHSQVAPNGCADGMSGPMESGGEPEERSGEVEIPDDNEALFTHFGENSGMSVRGAVVFTDHALTELAKDGLTTVDATNALRGGVVEEAEWEHGTWRHQVRTLRTVVVVEFEDETEVVVVTAWRVDR